MVSATSSREHLIHCIKKTH